MDRAALTNAHAYARAAYASTEDHGAFTTKNRAAAQKFGEAARDSKDTEAVRILKLLEEHHEKLSQIVKTVPNTPQDRRKAAQPSASPQDENAPDNSKQGTPPNRAEEAKTADRTTQVAHRRLQRESSSSIASDLATARGIPTVQQRGTRHAAMRLSKDGSSPKKARASSPTGSGEADRKSETRGELSKVHAQRSDVAGPKQATQSADETASEAAFQRFYSTFEGLLSKISAPLAFAGLPLNAEEQNQQTSQQTDPGKSAVSAGMADVARYFSKAALSAVKEGNEQGTGMHESFYVVPPSRAPVSYAGMLARERKHARSQSLASDADGEEQFVDAHETPQTRTSLSRIAQRASLYRSPTSNKTFEELEEENAQLKQLTDELAAKIYEWEKNSQNQYAALHQSVRFMQHPPRDSDSEQKEGSSQQRVRDLEEELRAAQKEVERRSKENEKLSTVVMRYRERWEKLKDQARGRRESGPAAAAA